MVEYQKRLDQGYKKHGCFVHIGTDTSLLKLAPPVPRYATGLEHKSLGLGLGPVGPGPQSLCFGLRHGGLDYSTTCTHMTQ